MRDYGALEKTERKCNLDFRDRPPIDDVLLALHLLNPGSQTHVRLMCNPLALEGPYIEVMICNGGYTREEHTQSEYYPVARKIVDELKKGHSVEGRKYPGYTDEYECTIGIQGRTAYWHAVNEFVGSVEEFLAREHPKVVIFQTTVFPRLHTMRQRLNFSDFFIGLKINEEQDEVRRTRGTFSLVRRETQNAE